MAPKAEDILFQAYIRTGTERRAQLVQEIIEFLEQNKLKTNLDRYTLYLVLDEAVTNAMEHGNRWDENKKVRARIMRRADRKLVVSVKDEGIGFNPRIIPDQLNVNGRLNTRGRGIYIIKKFCSVNWNILGNEIEIILEPA